MSEEIIVITVKLIIATQTALVSHSPEKVADYCCNLLFGGNECFWKGLLKGSWDPWGGPNAK